MFLESPSIGTLPPPALRTLHILEDKFQESPEADEAIVGRGLVFIEVGVNMRQKLYST